MLILVCFLSVATVFWRVRGLAESIGRRLADIGLNTLDRLFGLILTLIAVEVIANN